MSPIGQSHAEVAEINLVPGLVSDLQRAQGRAAELERQLSSRELDMRAMEARVAAVDAEAVARVARVAHAMAQADAQAGAARAEAEQRAAEAERRAAEAHARIDAIYRSSSWKLTGPFRRTIRLLRRLVGRG